MRRNILKNGCFCYFNFNSLLEHIEEYSTKIKSFRNDSIYNPGESEAYLVENFGYISQGVRNPEWEYHEMKMKQETRNSVANETDIDIPPLPLMIEIEPIHSCNLRCVMCHVPYEKLTHTKIDVNNLLKSLECFKGKGAWVSVGATYEPTLHPDFCALVEGLSELGFNIELTTNGTLLTSDIINRLSTCTIKNAVISFDGATKSIYEKMRINSHFETAIERITAFRKALSEAYMSVNYVVSKSTLVDIPNAVELWEKIGIQSIGFIPMNIRSSDKAHRDESLEPYIPQFKKMLELAVEKAISNNYEIRLGAAILGQMDDLKTKYPGKVLDGEAIPSSKTRMPFNPRSCQSGKIRGMPVSCRSPYTFARITFTGDLELCYQFNCQNLYNADFMSIWHGERAESVRSELKRNSSICKKCDYYRFCIRASEVDIQDKDNLYIQGQLSTAIPR